MYTPVTEYSYEPYMADRWNPFTSPHVEYRYVPHTRWDMHTEETQIPVTHRDLVPEQRVMQVPVTTQRLVAEEHITRVAVNGGGGSTIGLDRSIDRRHRQFAKQRSAAPGCQPWLV